MNNPLGTVCFSRTTLATLFDNHVPAISWKYHSAGSGIVGCAELDPGDMPAGSDYEKITGPEWGTNVI